MNARSDPLRRAFALCFERAFRSTRTREVARRLSVVTPDGTNERRVCVWVFRQRHVAGFFLVHNREHLGARNDASIASRGATRARARATETPRIDSRAQLASRSRTRAGGFDRRARRTRRVRCPPREGVASAARSRRARVPGGIVARRRRRRGNARRTSPWRTRRRNGRGPHPRDGACASRPGTVPRPRGCAPRGCRGTAKRWFFSDEGKIPSRPAARVESSRRRRRTTPSNDAVPRRARGGKKNIT